MKVDYTIDAYGDNAIMLDWGQTIDRSINQQCQQILQYLQANPAPNMTDVVCSYGAVMVCYQPEPPRVTWQTMGKHLEKVLSKVAISEAGEQPGRMVKVPVWYTCEGTDLAWVANALSCTTEAVVQMHTAAVYHVYMLGFLPGFPYMGEVDKALEVPRKEAPGRVTAGSVGLAGRQTGIYPCDSPGGWQIIGKSPVTLFDTSRDVPALIRPGDQVQFVSIDEDAYHRY